MSQESFWDEEREAAVEAALEVVREERKPSTVEAVEIGEIAAFFDRKDPARRQLAGIVRQALDEALDGARTGRYDIDGLNKVEKTFVGMRVELGLSHAFRLPDGEFMDFKIAGHDVDAKFSLNSNGWYIPPEAVGHYCLLVWASDKRSKFKVGLVLVTRDRLNIGKNRDKKVTLNEVGRKAITWIVEDGDLPRNTLLHLDKEVRDAIWAVKAGQRRVDALFLEVQTTIIPRVAIETVAKQTDPAKRARDSRRADRLGGRGILILGGDYKAYRIVARAFGLPEPEPGQWLSVRVANAMAGEAGATQIAGAWWRLAAEDDPAVLAPTIRTKGDAL